VELLINSAIKAQLSTLPDSDQLKTEAALHRLTQEFPNLPGLRRLGADGNLWELSITTRLRAFVRVESNRAEVIAVARPDQLQRYLPRELAR